MVILLRFHINIFWFWQNHIQNMGKRRTELTVVGFSDNGNSADGEAAAGESNAIKY